MKKLLLVIILAATLISGCIKSTSITEEMRTCEKDSDCIMIIPNSCCSCPTAVNIKYVDQIDTIPLNGQHQNCPKDIICKLCLGPSMSSTKCINNKCILEQKQENST